MRYHVTFVKQPVSEDDDIAWAHLRTVLERRDDEDGLPPDPVFLTLIDKLTARYPCHCDSPHEMENAGIWSGGPPRGKAGYSVAVLSLVAERIDEAMPFVLDTAHALGLVVFDEQHMGVYRPVPPKSRYADGNVTKRFRVAITGIRDGVTRDQAAGLLAPLFKRTEGELRRLLAMRDPVVKTGVSRAIAQKYVEALERCGCTCALQEEAADVALLRNSAIEQCRKLAEAGDSQAQFDLGCMFYDSTDEKRDRQRDCEQALHWWSKAAGQGHAAAQSNLAWLYHTGDNVPQDLEQSIAWARQAADLGVAGAQCFLGQRYEEGDAVEKDEHQAVGWYRKAAVQGLAEAQFRLGMLMLAAEGAGAGDADALLWLRKAAAQGHAPAQHRLGVIYERGLGVPTDPARAARWNRRAALQGHAGAQYALAVMHSEGRGVPQDFAEAAEWYRPAAEQGHANAQFNLAHAYRIGEGVPQDDALAAHWFARCADQGDAEAQAALGGCYFDGRGVAQDRERAAALFGKAAGAGHAGAQFALGMMHESGEGAPKEPDEAVKWLTLAAEHSNAEAQYVLGMKYCAGLGVQRNPEKAFDLLGRAAQQGHEDARAQMETFNEVRKGLDAREKFGPSAGSSWLH